MRKEDVEYEIQVWMEEAEKKKTEAKKLTEAGLLSVWFGNSMHRHDVTHILIEGKDDESDIESWLERCDFEFSLHTIRESELGEMAALWERLVEVSKKRSVNDEDEEALKKLAKELHQGFLAKTVKRAA